MLIINIAVISKMFFLKLFPILLVIVMTGLIKIKTVKALTTCTPDDIECIFISSQYTVYGTVLATNETVASSRDYNATISVNCGYFSFSDPKSDPKDLVGESILVTGFGDRHDKCPDSYPGATVTAGENYLFFLYVNNSASSDKNRIFSVTNPCGGPLALTSPLLKSIANNIVRYPNNVITSLNTATCPTLPAADPNIVAATSTPLATNDIFSNAARTQDIYILSIISTIVAASLIFAVFGSVN